jgi:hypothetical protein
MRVEDCRIAKQFAESDPQGKRNERIGLGTAREQEASRMRNVSIESSKKNYL